MLGCEHCGQVVPRPPDGAVESCLKCGRPMRRMDVVEAHEVAREGRIAEQFRAVARLNGPPRKRLSSVPPRTG